MSTFNINGSTLNSVGGAQTNVYIDISIHLAVNTIVVNVPAVDRDRGAANDPPVATRRGIRSFVRNLLW
jgi:hypothetical protein